MSTLTSKENVIRASVLIVLCLQNSIYTLLRRYSQGVLRESASKYEILLVGELIKIVFSVHRIYLAGETTSSLAERLKYVLKKSTKMLFLALMYGLMNILSFVALQNIGAGLFTICAQCKILTTATFSSLMLNRRYSAARWRALVQLILGVLIFSERIWNHKDPSAVKAESEKGVYPLLGTAAVIIEVTLSGFASIYFEKAIKTDPEKMSIWERNLQLAVWSIPVYIIFILHEGGGEVGYGGGWSRLTFVLACFGAGGGLLVALSIKYGDAILKTLATTGAIILSSFFDYLLLGGPLTGVMILAGSQVVLAIFNYTFDKSPGIGGGEASLPVLADHRVTKTMKKDLRRSPSCERAEVNS